MLEIKCDHHPKRTATATFRIIELPAGSRPLFIGYATGAHMLLDLCEECAEKVRAIEKDKNGS
jgi:hypothetical protein